MPKPEIQWFHNQQLILPTKDIVFHFDESTGMALMLIVDAYLEHVGQYSCKARNSAGEATCSATLTVTAEDSLFFLSLDYTVQALDRQSSGKDVRKSANSQAVAEVHIDSPFTKEENKISKKEIKSLQESSHEYEVQVFESISESSVSKSVSAQGIELYQATSIAQIAEGDQISEDNFEEERDLAPQILLKLKDMTMKCGDTAQFVCVVENGTSTGTTWTHEGVKMKESERVKQSQNGNVQLLTIQNVQLIDQGLYSCTIRNDHGEKTTSAVLTVEAKESQDRTVTKITLGSNTKSLKTLKESHIKTTREVKMESSKKTSSLSLNPS
ncbi:striated muscle preferentially expressed protein kinase-like [Macrotis lagotis]|uniref:striated muscle preferentially expressed protein kinase-like n=1 Tax=Macrotis lagotis TaxID=92651 RepID=UPI003D69C792